MSELPSMSQIVASAGIPMPPVFMGGLPGARSASSVPQPLPPLGYEKALAMLGLGHPVVRGIAGFTITGALLFTLRPDWAFDRKGHVRPWSFNMIGHAAKDGTKIPWWMACSAAAVAAAMFL